MNLSPRPIKSDIPVHNFKPEKEKVSRWSFMKVLREHSDLKEYYPEVNPFVECYRFRPNTYAIFNPSVMAGCGDVWSYLIIGPERALLIDTAFGLGDLRATCEHLAPGREVVCANTHRHVDHIGGNVCFDVVYINENDADALRDEETPDYMAGFLLDDDGRPSASDFDPTDLMPFHRYEVVGVPDGYVFDLGALPSGEKYEVELVHLSGHTAGQSGFFDRQTGCFFMGDSTSALLDEGERHPELCTIRSMRDRLQAALDRHGDQMTGVFPGHGAIDLHPVTLQYLIDAADLILAHPDQYDKKIEWFGRALYTKNVYQFGSDLKYTMETVG